MDWWKEKRLLELEKLEAEDAAQRRFDKYKRQAERYYRRGGKDFEAYVAKLKAIVVVFAVLGIVFIAFLVKVSLNAGSSETEMLNSALSGNYETIETNSTINIKLNKNKFGGITVLPNWKSYRFTVDKAQYIQFNLTSKKRTYIRISTMETPITNCFITSSGSSQNSLKVYLDKGEYLVMVATTSMKDFLKPKAELSVSETGEVIKNREGQNAIKGVTPVEPGKTYLGQISQEGEEDIYSFKLDKKKTVKNICKLDNNVNADLFGYEVYTKDDKKVKTGEYGYYYLEPGVTYYIRVFAKDVYKTDFVGDTISKNSAYRDTTYYILKVS